MSSVIRCDDCHTTLAEPVGPCPKCGGVITVSVQLIGQQVNTAQGNLTPWMCANYAPCWYKDALEEANQNGREARRREIIFAVACAESYLLEWVRDEVLKRDYNALNTYFNEKLGIKCRWKAVTKQLEKDKKIKKSPDYTSGTWQDFRDLVDYRDGLIHAVASLPQTDGHPKNLKPSMEEIDSYAQKKAINTIKNLILELNNAAGTVAPDWINS
jgi:hypothetical protein